MKQLSFWIWAAIFFLPRTTAAHGIGEVYSLPIPLGYYLFGAGLAVAISFFVLAIFLKNRDRNTAEDKFIRVPWLKSLLATIRVISVIVLGFSIVSGIVGSQSPTENFTPTFFWVFFLIGMSLMSIILGNFWDKISPWKAINSWLNLSTKGNRLIRGIIAPILLLGLFWLELASNKSFVPNVVGGLLFAYTVINLIAGQIFKNWFSHGELFSALFGFIGRLAHFRISDDEKGILRLNETKKLMDEVGSGSMIAIASIMLAGASFDSLKETAMWYECLKFLGIPTSGLLGPTIGIILAPIPFLAAYLFACWLMKLAAGISESTFVLAKTLVWSLIPIAFGYTLAHNFSLAIVTAPQMLGLISDPLGLGWNIFGTSSFEQPTLLLGAKVVWFTEIGLIILAHVVGVWHAHVIALNLIPNRRSAAISQLPIVVLMVGFTCLTLWLLSQPLVIVA